MDVRLEDCQLSEASRWDLQRQANVRCPPRRSSPWGAGKPRPRTWYGSCSWRPRSTGSRRGGRTCRACTGGAPSPACAEAGAREAAPTREAVQVSFTLLSGSYAGGKDPPWPRVAWLQRSRCQECRLCVVSEGGPRHVHQREHAMDKGTAGPAVLDPGQARLARAPRRPCEHLL